MNSRVGICRIAPSLFLTALFGCAPGEDAMAPEVLMQFDRAAGFYAAPFPSDDLRRADGTVDVSGFPNPDNISLIAQGLTLLARDARGFGLASGVFFTLTADLDPASLPAVRESLSAEAPVFLLDLERAERHPVRVDFAADGGPFGAAHLLSIVPVQGIPLRKKARYAAVVRSRWNSGAVRLKSSQVVADIAAGNRPAGLSAEAFAEYGNALSVLQSAGIPAEEIAGLAVYTTDDPTAALALFRTDLLSRPLPKPLSAPARSDLFPEYCVYHTTIEMLDYQQGTAPYIPEGGNWAVGADGKPVAPHPVECNLWVTVPRSPMPAAGYPTAVFVRTGGGGDRPLVDRGAQLAPGDPPIIAGSGPALSFARAGFAGVSVDGPLGGLRNPQMADEQYLIFNIQNAAALRDNVRESALELTLLPQILGTLSIDTNDCPGAAATTRFDLSKLALMGHSTGSVIATLALAAEPLYRVGLLSGAGGSWIENIMYKRKPQDVRPLAEILLHYTQESRSLTESDPALSLVQWAAESADGQVYAPQVIREPTLGAAPRHVLMMQGIVDNYIRPPIALAESVPLGLDLGGAALDAESPELASETHLLDVLPLTGRGMITLPAMGNRSFAGGAVTAVVVQHPQDAYEDGHEVVFQTDPPKHQYRCFLESFLQGTPVVWPGAPADAPCN